MEQETRNKLQRVTQQVRRLLESDFAEQLEGTYDILPNGKILAEPGKHLDARFRLVRHKLVDAIEHIKAIGKKSQEAVEEYTREAAFTFLNRFIALRMLEARGLLQECVSKGDKSNGFKEFSGLAPGLSALPDGGYRLYLECLFDELSVEVKVLFDRRDAASLLWPRHGTLNKLLEILGQADLTQIWSQDETIGWVYQYFNSDQDRRNARYNEDGKPKPPENSRELAVRNQFFTPRYVVEFLMDNTLGRIWYEMQKGNTRLVEDCSFLVRRPHEIFVDEAQKLPQDDFAAELSQQELLNQPVYIPNRAKKDPRDLKILDPACGSGHFLLYAFDLLRTIYDEAWRDETSVPSEVTGKCLREDYSDIEHLHAALPGMLLRYNLYGIDIDPRATQIAALALWMRAQRAYTDLSIAREIRPLISKSNIVCAEPMPGESSLLDDFVREYLSTTPEDRLLGQLVRRVFQEMQLAGEAGSLLRIEEEISEVVQRAKENWRKEPEFVQTTLFVPEANKPQQQKLDFRGVTNEHFWEQAEHLIYTSLQSFSQHAESDNTFQRSLFSDDASRGFAFVDLCRAQYDVIVMNPPFGEVSGPSRSLLAKQYPGTYKNIFGAFIERALRLINSGGRIGAITSRTFLFLPDFEYLRDDCLAVGRKLVSCCELGEEVLDNATVRVSAAVLSSRPSESPIWFARLSDHNPSTKGDELKERVTQHRNGQISAQDFLVPPSAFEGLPGKVFAYTTPAFILKLFSEYPSLQPHYAWVRRVPGTGDNDTSLRLRTEVPIDELAPHGNWCSYSKGGSFSPFYSDCDLVIATEDVAEICDPTRLAGIDLDSKPQNSQLFGAPSLTFAYANDFGLDVRPLRAGSLFDSGGPIVFPIEYHRRWWLMGLLNSRIIRRLLFVLTPERFKQVGLVQQLPISTRYENEIANLAKQVAVSRATLEQLNETSPVFCSPLIFSEHGLQETIANTSQFVLNNEANYWRNFAALDEYALDAFGLSNENKSMVINDIGLLPTELPEPTSISQTSPAILTISGREIGKGSLSCSYHNAGLLERICHSLGVRVFGNTVEAPTVLQAAGILEKHFISALISWCVGLSFGRWDIRRTYSNLQGLDEETLFGMLAPCSPGMLTVNGLPMTQNDYDTSTETSTDFDFAPSWNGILVHDSGHPKDLFKSIRACLACIWPTTSAEAEEQLCAILKVADLQKYLQNSFFSEHVKRYSQSKRKAPIYWQLSTPSASYSVWLYYHRFTKDTFFKINEIVKDKLKHERLKMEQLRREAGAEPTKSQRSSIEQQEMVLAEVSSFAEEVERVAPLWNPDLNDGVIINFAPLWRLVPQNKSWQAECKSCWDELVRGDCDWAHLAMHLWPERVVPKCVTDYSLAVAHGLQETFWREDEQGRVQPLEKPTVGWEPVIAELVKQRTSPAVKAAIRNLLDAAPTSFGPKKTRKRKSASS